MKRYALRAFGGPVLLSPNPIPTTLPATNVVVYTRGGNAKCYVRSGDATVYTRDGNITVFID